MSDLISRSAAINILQELADMETCGNHLSDIGFGLSMAIGRLISAPAVDAVPVVRCRECKWWGLPEGMYATENIKHCEFGRYMVASDGYCVYGEVKSNAAD